MADTPAQAALRLAFNSKLSVIEQTLTPEQQQQARNNIGALSESDLSDQIKEAVLSIFFPVGSIYVSANDTFDPNTQWGGTWTKIEDCFLLGSGTRGVGATGGEENVTLNTNQIPSHSHTRGSMDISGDLVNGDVAVSKVTGAFYDRGNADNGAGGKWVTAPQISFQASRNWSGYTSSSGGGQSHNNMPPYQVVNIWKRTA